MRHAERPYRRSRPGCGDFLKPAACLHESAARGGAEGHRAGPDSKAPIIVTGNDVRVWFSIKRGFLRRTVGYIKAVDGIDVTVRQGQTLGVVGESGSGKTTLGLALLRLIRSEGVITYLGQRLDGLRSKEMRPFRRDMQVVFQDPYGSLSPRLSVAEIVAEGLRVQNRKLSERQRREIVAARARRYRPRSRGDGPLSARIFRRPAAAHRHRAGDGA